MKTILTVIVPIGPLAGRTENLFKWIKAIREKPLEVILVFDDNMDGTREIITEELAKMNYNNITFLSGAYGGPGVARNEAIPLVKSEWFAFWDADDLPSVDKFLKMIDEAADNGFKVAMGQFSVKDFESRLTRYFTRAGSKDWELSLAQSPGIWRFAFSSKEFQQLRFPALLMGEDQIYLALLNLKKADVYETNEIVYEYFVGMSQQLTQNKYAIVDLTHAGDILEKISKGELLGNKRLASFMFVKQQLTKIKKENLNISSVTSFGKLVKYLMIKPPTKTYVLSKILLKKRKYSYPNQIIIQGGLGNQLFQISALLSISGDNPCQVLSERNGFEKLPTLITESLLDELTGSIECAEIRRSFLLKKYLNLALLISSSYSESDTVFKRAFLNILRSVVQQFYMFVRSPQKLFIARGIGEDTKISGNLEGKLLIGYFQSHRYAMSIREPIKEIVTRRIDDIPWLKQLKIETQSANALILQVRLGDYLQNPQFGALDASYFNRALELAGCTEPLYVKWLFSDDEQGARKRLINVPKYRFEVVVPNNSQDFDVLCAMTLGKKFVISNSTFGWWGAFLSSSGLQKDAIYYPQPWFLSIPSPLNLTPPNWNACPVRVS
jgi:glycosyltransferase involved in cell wall biosynthesis